MLKCQMHSSIHCKYAKSVVHQSQPLGNSSCHTQDSKLMNMHATKNNCPERQ